MTGRRQDQQPARVPCPSCGSQDSRVRRIRSRSRDHAVIRRRICRTCGYRFRTAEQIEPDHEKVTDPAPVP